MRVLKFTVDENHFLAKDPKCDFDNLIPGTKGYLVAEFNFHPSLAGYTKVVEFRSTWGREYPPQLLTDGTKCYIPEEALKKRAFKIAIIGKKGDSRIKSNYVIVNQDGGKK